MPFKEQLAPERAFIRSVLGGAEGAAATGLRASIRRNEAPVDKGRNQSELEAFSIEFG